jgi:hypothetical protein
LPRQFAENSSSTGANFENLGPPPLVREAIPQHLLGVLAIGEDLDDVQRL